MRDWRVCLVDDHDRRCEVIVEAEDEVVAAREATGGQGMLHDFGDFPDDEDHRLAGWWSGMSEYCVAPA